MPCSILRQDRNDYTFTHVVETCREYKKPSYTQTYNNNNITYSIIVTSTTIIIINKYASSSFNKIIYYYDMGNLGIYTYITYTRCPIHIRYVLCCRPGRRAQIISLYVYYRQDYIETDDGKMPSVFLLYIIIYRAISNNNVLYIIYTSSVLPILWTTYSTVVVKMRLGNYYRYYLFLVIVRCAYLIATVAVLGTITDDVILCIIGIGRQIG